MLGDHLFLFQSILYKMKVITIESDYINGDSGSLSDYMCSIVETLCVIKKKLGYFLGNSCIICILQIFWDLTLLWTFSIFFQIQYICKVFLKQY